MCLCREAFGLPKLGRFFKMLVEIERLVWQRTATKTSDIIYRCTYVRCVCSIYSWNECSHIFMLNVTLLGISINMSLTCETLIVSRLGTLMLMEQTNEKKNISIKMLTKRIRSITCEKYYHLQIGGERNALKLKHSDNFICRFIQLCFFCIYLNASMKCIEFAYK